MSKNNNKSGISVPADDEGEWMDEEWVPNPIYRTDKQIQNNTRTAKSPASSSTKSPAFPEELAAAWLENAKGGDPESQRIHAEGVAEFMQGHKSVMKFIREQRLIPEDTLWEANNQTAVPFAAAESRILNALGALLEEAKGKESAHQLAMTKAAADITGALKGIRELRQKDATLKSAAQSTALDENAEKSSPVMDPMERAKRQALDRRHQPPLDRNGSLHSRTAYQADNPTFHR